MLQDQQKGFIGEFRDLDSIDFDSCLLVDSFGVWERRAGGVRKIRVISNYRSNEVNAHAWVPSKMRYNSYDALKEASSILKDSTDGMLQMGKADCKSAFKTLPVSSDQQWLGWALVYCPTERKHKVAQINSQSFGSLGAVAAWYRTARLVQHVMLNIFGYVILCMLMTASGWPLSLIRRPTQG